MMKVGRSELVKTLEAGAFAFTLILLALVQAPSASSRFGLFADALLQSGSQSVGSSLADKRAVSSSLP